MKNKCSKDVQMTDVEPKNDTIIKTKYIDSIRRVLKENIMNPVLLSRHPNETAELYKLLRRLVDNGESNSALLIGSRGSGKTRVVMNAINMLKEESDASADCVIVHLNGYVHTDDRLALKAIAVQMKLENAVGDQAFGSFAENLTFLLQCFREGNRISSKSILIILDEFDLFCHHHNQTLLYNLFDVAQSAQAPICVLGVSCRSDVVDLLEKRVKSRFSNRKIYLHSVANLSEAQIVNNRLQDIEKLLSVPGNLSFKSNLNSSTICTWNELMKNLCKNPSVKSCIKAMCEWGFCERLFRDFLFRIVSKLGCDHKELTPNDFIEMHSLMHQNRRVSMMEGLPVLELCLIISMMHHTMIYEESPFNFELVYSRLLKFDCNNSKILNADREVAFKAFEHLKSIELLLPLSTNQVSKEYQMFRLVVLPDEVREAVSNNKKKLPLSVVQWADSDLT